ncbi:hypothetical protein MYSTI_07800 [Myxococcus stipitatus DSM 14675]|uniref:Uncharacterized protein n=1 Tax=Myxococcus stipitatus (strain DSM 14675 / JCM 12634 / Mx s8) TaxID=1278073 RepID=L7UNB5_MYXSD|nr:hypothetical protein [Myxococcus stipitatus]AGC49072.1 hypothetical protein MYSTI_07800 [Myxococcus stipitatus DSM 14675]
MKNLSAKGKAQRLMRIFQRTGGEDLWTHPVGSFPETVRAVLLEQVKLMPTELPVLACFENEDQWTLVTTARVVVKTGPDARSLHWGDIEDATVDSGYVSAALACDPRGKLALNRLTLVCRDGERVALFLEPGPPFFGFWNVLKSIGNSTKN